MKQYYFTTPLEQWVDQLWEKAGVDAVSRLNIDDVSSRLEVWVHYAKETSRALEFMGMRSILIDSRLGRQQQWEEFLHELCHVLRHAGNQTLMPRSFCEWQEAEANRFVLYAALPFSLLEQLKLPDRLSEAVEVVACKFDVTYELAYKRLEQIKRRMLAAILWEEAVNQETRDFMLQLKMNELSTHDRSIDASDLTAASIDPGPASMML